MPKTEKITLYLDFIFLPNVSCWDLGFTQVAGQNKILCSQIEKNIKLIHGKIINVKRLKEKENVMVCGWWNIKTDY